MLIIIVYLLLQGENLIQYSFEKDLSLLSLSKVEGKWKSLDKKKGSLSSENFLLSKKNAQLSLKIFDQNIHFKKPIYLYLKDLTVTTEIQLLDELMLLELSAIKVRPKETLQKTRYGITYGSAKSEIKIPFKNERTEAINSLAENGLYYQAILIQKKLMSQYPQLEKNIDELKRLFEMLYKAKLYSSLRKDCKACLNLKDEAIVSLAESYLEKID
jgi:hypothetical protein